MKFTSISVIRPSVYWRDSSWFFYNPKYLSDIMLLKLDGDILYCKKALQKLYPECFAFLRLYSTELLYPLDKNFCVLF